MIRLNRRKIGVEHNELDMLADRLHEDGEKRLATQYSRLARREEATYVALRSLGHYVVEGLHIPDPPPDDRWPIGADLADWLLKNGWRPPESFENRLTEVDGNDD